MYKVKMYVLFFFLCVNLVGLSAQQDLSKLSWHKVSTGMPAEWYGTEQAANIADTVLHYQTAIGGWPKNVGFHKHVNQEEMARVRKSGIGATFDNGATLSEMRFLAKVYTYRKDERYRNAFLKAFNYILEAQYDNGGWPQFYPVRKGRSVSYSGHVTYNDNAYVNVMNMLKDIFTDAPCFRSLALGDEVRAQAKASFDKGVDCILKSQIVIDGELTAWCAQHDSVTLQPAKARAYELPSISGAESANIVLLLMSIPHPSDDVVKAVKSAVKWFDERKIADMRYERFRDKNGKRDSRLVPEKGSVVWGRFYDLETQKPYFSDRDGIKKNSLEEIGQERRGGYSWYCNNPGKVLKAYPKWLEANGLKD